MFRDGETRRKEDWKFGLPCIDYKRAKQGQPTNQPIAPRRRSCPQLQLTVIDCLPPTRGYPITRRRDESHRLSHQLLYLPSTPSPLQPPSLLFVQLYD